MKTELRTDYPAQNCTRFECKDCGGEAYPRHDNPGDTTVYADFLVGVDKTGTPHYAAQCWCDDFHPGNFVPVQPGGITVAEG